MKSFPPSVNRARIARRALLAAASIAVTGALCSSALAEELDNLAKRLATLRGDVEALSDELAARKDDLQEQVRSFGRQKSELDLQIQREDARVQKLRQAVAQQKAQAEAEQAAQQDVGPAFERHLQKVRRYVEDSLPFRMKERLAELDKIEHQYKQGLLAPQRALNRLWGFVEDELRMTRESGLYAHPVTIEGEEQLAEVIRVGMVTLYYKTADGQLGNIVEKNGVYAYEPIVDDDARKQVRDLFATFKKQIRVGYFTLPNALGQIEKAQ